MRVYKRPVPADKDPFKNPMIKSNGYTINGLGLVLSWLWLFVNDKKKTSRISKPKNCLARFSLIKLIEYAPIITAGKPIIIPSLKSLWDGLLFSKNFSEAPKPNKTVETLWVARATGKEISKRRRIAGSWIIPAPPPEKAEKRFDKKDIKRRKKYSKV